MNFNKKFDRLRRWGDEKLGAAKTDADEDFKALEVEMNTRHKGIEKLHGSAMSYVRALTEKKSHPESKEKATYIGNVGVAMTKHGHDFDDESKFGQCLIGYGQANERIARVQEGYASSATTAWIEPLDRSLVQLKEYQNARKRLESRRLAYDTSLNKIQKSNKEDFRLDDELRTQKIKYEESKDEVCRRMQDITEAESDLMGDLYTMLEAQLNYHDRCREILLQLRQDWPAGVSSTQSGLPRPPIRSRASTLSRAPTTQTIDENAVSEHEFEAPPRLPLRPSRAPSAAASPTTEPSGFNFSSPQVIGGMRTPLAARASNPEASGVRPAFSRSTTDSSINRLQLRPTRSRMSANDAFSDNEAIVADDSSSSSPERRSSGASSVGIPTRNTSWSTLDQIPLSTTSKKTAPPPPPPRRDSSSSVGKKAPPPPPPMKRSQLSTSSIPPVA